MDYRKVSTAALVAALLGSPAHAGWFSDWCGRYLIADDPYQYEDASSEWISREIAPLEVREAWGKLTPRETEHLQVLRGELRRRARGL